MKKNTRTWLSAILGGCVITTASAPAALAVTKEEIMTLAKLGIAADEIIKTIEKDRTVFDLSVAEILELKKANVPEKVIKFMLETPKKYGGDVALPRLPERSMARRTNV